MSDFKYNVGEVVLRNDECFWIFDSDYLFHSSHVLCKIHSPWFSCSGEMWCLVKPPRLLSDSKPLVFRIWRKFGSNRLADHIIKLRLETNCERCVKFGAAGSINSDYGCELKFTCTCHKNIVTQNGLIKLFFDIQKKRNINKCTTSTSLDILVRNDVIHSGVPKSSKNGNFSYDEATKNDSDGVKGLDRLLRDLKNLLLNGKNSDVVFKVGNQEFKAHRNILVSRSPVFASMFQNDTKESITGEVDVPDCSAKAFEVLLHYIYSGSADVLASDNVFELFYISDKYQVNDLKSECVDYIEKNLSVDNFCSVMSLSLQHSESSLLKEATKFFCDNVKIIVKTAEWQNYMKDNPVPANELYIKAINA